MMPIGLASDFMAKSLEVATIGGGCFWCFEAIFSEIDGIEKVESGYAGGNVAFPSYDQIESGKTGHAQVVQLTYDSDVITYRQILQIFFTMHDPTTKDRQGADVGTQYRSIILYHNKEQKEIAEKVMNEIQDSKIWNGKLVTEIASLKQFYKAEGYHQGYFARNPNAGYCRIVIEPKIVKLRQKYFKMLKK